MSKKQLSNVHLAWTLSVQMFLKAAIPKYSKIALWSWAYIHTVTDLILATLPEWSTKLFWNDQKSCLHLISRIKKKIDKEHYIPILYTSSPFIITGFLMVPFFWYDDGTVSSTTMIPGHERSGWHLFEIPWQIIKPFSRNFSPINKKRT